MRKRRTSIKLILQIFYDRRASAESIDALLLVSLHFFQILDTAKDDGRKASDLGNLKRLLQRYAKHRAVDVCRGNRFFWAYRSNVRSCNRLVQVQNTHLPVASSPTGTCVI